MVPFKSLGLVLLILTHAAAAEVPVLGEAWGALSAGDARGALNAFRLAEEREGTGAAREMRVGRAASLLTVQPRTAANLEEARELLEGVRAEAERDDWRVLATYLLARWYQVHALVPNAVEAERLLAGLLESDAGHRWADPAAPKLAILRLYGEVDRAEFGRRCDALEAWLPRLHEAGARRDTRLVIADAALRLHADHARALPHLRALLEEAEALRPSLRARVLFQAAESAGALGRAAEAVVLYRRFNDEFPRDARVGEAIQRAQILSAL